MIAKKKNYEVFEAESFAFGQEKLISISLPVPTSPTTHTHTHTYTHPGTFKEYFFPYFTRGTGQN